MYGYKWKKIGIIISITGLLFMVIERLKGFIIIPQLNAAQHYSFFEWIMLLGLATIIYSKEKYDDERAQAIRLKSFQISFMLTMSVLMGTALTKALGPASSIEPKNLFFIAGLGIISYLLFFHIGIYFDFLWEYDDEKLARNRAGLEKNALGKLVFIIAGAIIILILELL